MLLQHTATVRPFQLAPKQYEGRKVWVNGKRGIIDSLGISPYWTESKQGVIRAYVLAVDTEKDFWTSYELVSELDFGTECYFCGENHAETHTCSECSGCMDCCSCSHQPIESDEVLDREYADWCDQADRRFEEARDYRAIRESRV